MPRKSASSGWTEYSVHYRNGPPCNHGLCEPQHVRISTGGFILRICFDRTCWMNRIERKPLRENPANPVCTVCCTL